MMSSLKKSRRAQVSPIIIFFLDLSKRILWRLTRWAFRCRGCLGRQRWYLARPLTATRAHQFGLP